MTYISRASGARFRSRPLSRVVLFEPHEALRASILALAHFQNRRWYHRSPQSTLLGVVVLGRKQLGKQAAGFVLLFLRDDLKSDARKKKNKKKKKKGERRFVRRRSRRCFFWGNTTKDEPQSGIELIEMEIRIDGSSTRDDFRKKIGKKRRTTIFSLFRLYLACVVVVGLFSTLGETQKRDDDDDDKDDDDAVKLRTNTITTTKKVL